ncbi:unnamed protein product [Rotaria socialis]|uniref:Uncharacterized protein n=1 Tax=Rotaria socialis TaxID=392032 RepID=A0A817XJG1_9BILA|nr:unnamed protein product [Rotaria socialis]
MALCVIYPLALYISLVIRYTCQTMFDYSYWTCGGPCYIYEPVLGPLDWIVNGCLNVILSSLATLIIIIRVLWQHQ